MKITLLKQARVLLQAGETVETEDAYAANLIALGLAEEAKAAKKAPSKSKKSE